MIRWAGVSALLIFSCLTILIAWFFSDQWFEETIEETASIFNKAKVEIDDFHISFLKMEVNWKRLQITDPQSTMKNRLEMGQTSFDLEFLPLLSNKIIINEMILDSIRTNTDRTEDGQLDSVFYEESSINQAIEFIKTESSEFASEKTSEVTENVKSESIIPDINIKSIDRIKTLQNSIDSSTSVLKSQIKSANLDQRFEKIKSTVNQISISNMKDIGQIKSAISSMSTVRQDLNAIQTDFSKLKKTSASTLLQLESVAKIDNWINEDYQHALKQAKIPDFSVGSIAKTLFGKALYSQYHNYLEYFRLYEEYSAYFSSEEVTKEKSPPRLKGQTIHFYKQTAEPDFWIKLIKIGIQLEDGTYLSGNASDIVSNQLQIQKPTQVKLNGSNVKGSIISLKATFDHLKEIASDTIIFKINKFPISNYKLSSSELFPESIKSALGDFRIDLKNVGGRISGTTEINARDVSYQFDVEKKSKTQTLIEDIFSGISKLQISAGLTIENGNPDILIRSNLDKAISEGLKQSANRALLKLKDEIRKKLESEINPAKNNFLSSIGASKSDVQLIFDQLDSKQGALDQLYENKKKFLNDKIETEKKKLGFLGATLLKGLKIN